MSMPPPPPPPFGSPTPSDAGGPPQYGQPSYAQQPPGYPASGMPPAYPAYQQGYGQGYGQNVQYASFGARLGALLLDALVGLLFAIPVLIAWVASPKTLRACTVNGEARLCKLPTGAGFGLIILVGIGFALAYLVVFCRMVGRGQSIGMKALGIKLTGAETGQPVGSVRAFGWYLAHAVSGFLCYLGYLWMLWDKRKQTWHDKIAGTVMVKA